MTLRSAPIFKVEDAPDVIDDLAQWVRLLRVDPDNPAAEEARARLADAKREIPEFLLVAVAMVAVDFRAEDELRERPESCPSCRGEGALRLSWCPEHVNCGSQCPRRRRACRCPLAIAIQRGRTLAQDSFDRGIVWNEPQPETQKQLVMFAGVSA